MCHNEWITSDFMIVSFHILALLSRFRLAECIFYRQVLVQNARTHIVAATASLCLEARNKQTNKKNRYLNPLTQISLWSIACFCNVAQIEKGREKKKKKTTQPQPTVFTDLRYSLLSWQCSALSLFSWTFDQMTKAMNFIIKSHSCLMGRRNSLSWSFMLFSQSFQHL